MDYKKDIRPYLNFVLEFKNHDQDFSVIVLFHTPNDCSCGYPHGVLMIQTSNEQVITLCDYSMETDQSFGNFVTSIDALTDFPVFDEVIEALKLRHKLAEDIETSSLTH